MAHVGTGARGRAWALALASLAATASGFGVAPCAKACGGTPFSVTLLAQDGVVYAGSGVLKLYVYGTTLDLAKVRSELSMRTAAGVTHAIPITLRATGDVALIEVVLQGEALVADAHYTLKLSVDSSDSIAGFDRTITFESVVAPPEPSSLGALVLESQASGRLGYGGCGGTIIGAHAVLGLSPSAALLPFERAARHELIVNGQSAHAPELLMTGYVENKKRMAVRAIAVCRQAEYDADAAAAGAGLDVIEVELDAGQHSVVWQSRFPSGKVLRTSALDIDLRCEGGGADAGPAAADAGVADAGAGSVQVDAGVADAGRAQGAPSEASAGAEGCSLSQRPGSAVWAGAIAMLATLLSRRRRREAPSWPGA
ncbi:MAG: hypothetical protein RL385_2725 [Pseudomonadota bacterium]